MLAIYQRRTRQIIGYLIQYSSKCNIIAPYLGKSVLDIGCGNGTLVPFLPEGTSYVGIDVNPDWISQLKLQHPEYAFYLLDLDRDPLPESLTGISFSSIVLSAIIEHLKNPDFILDQCQSLMNDTTRLIITTPTALGDLVSRTLERMFLGNPYTKDIHPHVRHYSGKALASLGEAYGLACTYYRRLGWHRQNQLAIYRKRLKPGD